MKIISKIGFTVLAVVCATVTMAQTVPTYTTKNASGTTTCEVHFPANPQQQVRIVGAIATSDKAASVLSWRTGSTPYTISATNAAGTTITVSYTNGLAANDVLVIQKANGTCISGTISSFANSTNITLAATTGAQTLPGDEVYKMSAATTIKVGATTVTYQGEAIYVGTRGRPVRVVLDGTSACSLDSITARYE